MKFTARVYATKDKKKLKNGIKEYNYGTINIRAPELSEYVGKFMSVVVTPLSIKKSGGKK